MCCHSGAYWMFSSTVLLFFRHHWRMSRENDALTITVYFYTFPPNANCSRYLLCENFMFSWRIKNKIINRNRVCVRFIVRAQINDIFFGIFGWVNDSDATIIFTCAYSVQSSLPQTQISCPRSAAVIYYFSCEASGKAAATTASAAIIAALLSSEVRRGRRIRGRGRRASERNQRRQQGIRL